MKVYYHKHHILPKHAGGTNHPDNLVILTVEEHAEAHWILWVLHNRWQDKIAWLALSGRIEYEAATRLASSLANTGRKHTDKTKKKMSEAQKGRVYRTGFKLSEQTKRKMSESRKGRLVSDETRLKIALSKKGNVTISDKQRLQISKANTGRKHTVEAKEKISEAGKLRVHSVKTKQKMSKLHKTRFRARASCIYCRKESTTSTITRYHGDNCRLKEEICTQYS